MILGPAPRITSMQPQQAPLYAGPVQTSPLVAGAAAQPPQMPQGGVPSVNPQMLASLLASQQNQSGGPPPGTSGITPPGTLEGVGATLAGTPNSAFSGMGMPDNRNQSPDAYQNATNGSGGVTPGLLASLLSMFGSSGGAGAGAGAGSAAGGA